jgi:3-phytase
VGTLRAKGTVARKQPRQRWWQERLSPLIALAVIAGLSGLVWTLLAIPRWLHPDQSPYATVETQAFPVAGTFDNGDVADDSAIWINPSDPARSAVIADDKDPLSGGIAVYDMSGKLLQFRQEGQIGNVDLRQGFRLGGRRVVLVGANNRSDNTIRFWVLDPVTRQLTPVDARDLTTLSPNYGFCMYRSPSTGKVYAFVSQAGRGRFEQYELFDARGHVDARRVRAFNIGSQSEGCVADDELGHLYVGEEDTGIWKYGAEPTAGAARSQVDRVGGHVAADVEGLTLAYGVEGTGYLMVSSQGDSTIAVYERARDNAFVKRFRIAGNGSIDAVSDIDGIDATSANAGPGFQHGVLVAHDATNSGDRNSNLKYVPLEQIVNLPPPPTSPSTPGMR